MTTPATDGKQLMNALYHSAVVSGLAIGYARITRMALGGAASRLDFAPCDIGLMVADVAIAIATKNMLIKPGIIPADIMK